MNHSTFFLAAHLFIMTIAPGLFEECPAKCLISANPSELAMAARILPPQRLRKSFRAALLNALTNVATVSRTIVLVVNAVLCLSDLHSKQLPWYQ